MRPGLQFDTEAEIDLEGLEGALPKVIRDLKHCLTNLLREQTMPVVVAFQLSDEQLTADRGFGCAWD